MSDQSTTHRPRVLVVEDHTDTAQLVLTILEGSGYDALREGQKVSYNEGRGPKGPRAENVRPI